MPGHVEACLRYALTTQRFCARDLPGEMDDAGKLVLTKRLLRAGILHGV